MKRTRCQSGRRFLKVQKMFWEKEQDGKFLERQERKYTATQVTNDTSIDVNKSQCTQKEHLDDRIVFKGTKAK